MGILHFLKRPYVPVRLCLSPQMESTALLGASILKLEYKHPDIQNS